MAPAHEEEGTTTGETGVLSRHPTAFAVGGGLAAAFGSSFIPMTAIEGFVTAYGIAELLPAAAPPLGDTARLALSAGIGTLTAGALLALLPRPETEEMGFEATVKKAASADSSAVTSDTATGKGGKLAGWLRTLRFGKSEPAAGTVTDFADINRLRIRNGDQHPDAPVRSPILASSDLAEPTAPAMPMAAELASAAAAAMPLELGEDMAFAAPSAADEDITESPIQAPSFRFAPPTVAEPDVEVEAEAETGPVTSLWPEALADRAAAPEFADSAEDAAAGTEQAFSTQAPADTNSDTTVAEPLYRQDAEDLEALSVAELIERLETGLVRRRQSGLETSPSGAALPEATARLFSLAKPPSLAGDASVDEQSADVEARPLRFRLEQPAEAELDTAPQTPAPFASTEALRPENDVWTSAVDYQPPAISGVETQALPTTELPADTAETGETGETKIVAAIPEPVASPAQPMDDDMDAALRDALATLRQLSDRQRNA